ncbi:MAG TPA: RidA family protein [Vicinamibacterales bacterium]|jgi:enamine deaminase RidA (YjgF/YER057c/UK114 family)|nr:RidA family protein [Vicinamibacterales bacterium]
MSYDSGCSRLSGERVVRCQEELVRTRKTSWHASMLAVALACLASLNVAAQGAGSFEARLKELGIVLPPAPKPLASYVPSVRTGNLVYLAGQGPIVDGKATVTGKVGAQLTEAEGYKVARASILVSLAVLRAEIGSLDRVTRIVKVVGWVNSAPGFTRQPWVINGASDLLVEIFGEAGRHARSAVGANELPLDIPVEIEMVVEVAPG